MPLLLFFRKNSWGNVDDSFSSVIIHDFKAFAQKIWPRNTDFAHFLKKVPPWLILWLFIQLKKVWGPKLCVSLTLCPNPSVYNDIDICSFEKSHDSGHSFKHIGENSWYNEATLKKLLILWPLKNIEFGQIQPPIAKSTQSNIFEMFFNDDVSFSFDLWS